MSKCGSCAHDIVVRDDRIPPWCPLCGADWKLVNDPPPGTAVRKPEPVVTAVPERSPDAFFEPSAVNRRPFPSEAATATAPEAAPAPTAVTTADAVAPS